MHQNQLLQLVARHAPTEGVHPTSLDGIQLFRLNRPVQRLPGIYEPSLCFIVQGEKRAYLDGRTYTYNSEHYLCATMPMPLEGEVVQASEQDPVLGLVIKLETPVGLSAVVEYEVARQMPHREHDPKVGFVISKSDEKITQALRRALELLDDQLALRMVGEGRLREIYFAILLGETGPLIRRDLGSSHGISRILYYIRDNLHSQLSVDKLASMAQMSRAVFDRRFKATTTFSPLQFIKLMRLNKAAMMIATGATISEAADSVGYASSSQFSREFRRHFGQPPSEWRTKHSRTESDARQALI